MAGRLKPMVGSSPRARGTRFWDPDQDVTHRFIPAGAGNASARARYGHLTPVHPRGRGERLFSSPHRASLTGSSPRARGTHEARSADSATVRFIPAGAGNANQHRASAAARAVHPRGRGERGSAVHTGTHHRGSSPRARGTRLRDGVRGVRMRFIPAGAGNAARNAGRGSRPSVHPRGRGERHLMNQSPTDGRGSSPRARGTPSFMRKKASLLRFIPAGAGNAIHHTATITRNGGSSPRARGTRGAGAPARSAIRFIPAGAGNARIWAVPWESVTVHPRGRGERARSI